MLPREFDFTSEGIRFLYAPSFLSSAFQTRTRSTKSKSLASKVAKGCSNVRRWVEETLPSPFLLPFPFPDTRWHRDRWKIKASDCEYVCREMRIATGTSLYTIPNRCHSRSSKDVTSPNEFQGVTNCSVLVPVRFLTTSSGESELLRDAIPMLKLCGRRYVKRKIVERDFSPLSLMPPWRCLNWDRVLFGKSSQVRGLFNLARSSENIRKVFIKDTRLYTSKIEYWKQILCLLHERR